MTDPSAEAEPHHAGRNDNPSGRHKTDRLRRRVEIQPGCAAIRAGNLCRRVHFHIAHEREVNYKPAVTDAVTGGIMPASTHGNLKLICPCKIKSDCDITSTDTTCNDRRT